MKPLAKGKSKVGKHKTEFDYTRKAEGSKTDPRWSKTTWPCFGVHQAKTGANRFGLWEECARCGMRMSYTPAVNAPAQATHIDHPTNVVEALNRLRTNGWEENEISGTQVKAMITVVAKEFQLTKPKGQKGYPKDNKGDLNSKSVAAGAKPKAETKKKKKKDATGQDTMEEVSSSEEQSPGKESWQQVDP